MTRFATFETISLKNHPVLNEQWVQERIAEDPSMLELGRDLILKDKERIQPRAGRLDLLLQDAEKLRRYEVEVQLGATDESHIIRTIEYWDIERRRYPQYEHTAVIVAENITARFLNVISLFNGMIPLVAIQMRAVKFDEQVGLLFTKVLDQMVLGLVDDDEDVQETTDRAYWESRGSQKTLAICDELLSWLKDIDATLEMKYTKVYIGLAKGGKTTNFVVLKPKKNFVRIEPRLDRSAEVETLLDDVGLDGSDYIERNGRYKLNIYASDMNKQKEAITKVLQLSYDQWNA